MSVGADCWNGQPLVTTSAAFGGVPLVACPALATKRQAEGRRDVKGSGKQLNSR